MSDELLFSPYLIYGKCLPIDQQGDSVRGAVGAVTPPNLDAFGNLIVRLALGGEAPGNAPTEIPTAPITDDTTASSGIGTAAFMLGFDGTAWDQIRALSDDADAQTAAGLGALLSLARLEGFNGSAWDRIRALADNADAQTVAGLGALLSLARLEGFNGATWDRIRALADDADAQTAAGLGALLTLARTQAWNGSAWDRLRTASAAVQANYAGHTGISAVAMAGNWSVTHDPGINTRATVTRAAGGAGVRHVCTSIHAALSSTMASGQVKVYLRDGASGAGPILWSSNMIVGNNQTASINLSGLSIVGSANTAMTLEFNAAGGGGTQENVSLTGYSVG